MYGRSFVLASALIVLFYCPADAPADLGFPPPIFSGPENRIPSGRLDSAPPPADSAPPEAQGKSVVTEPAPFEPSMVGAPIPVVATRSTNQISRFPSQGVVTLNPLISLEISNPAETNLGKAVTFTINVKNLGAVDASNVTVDVAVSPTATIARTSPIAPNLNESRIRIEVGDVPAQSKKQLTVQVVPQAAGQLNLTADVSFSSNTNVSVAVTQPKLSIHRIGPGQVVYGATAQHKVVITNTGDGKAEDVQFASRLPSGLRITNADQWSSRMGTLGPGESREIQIATVAQMTGRLKMNLAVRAEGVAEVSINDELQVLRPMLEVVTQGPDLNYLSRSGVYSIIVSNPGDAQARHVQVTNKLPEGLQVSAVEKAAMYNKKTRSVVWDIPSLPPGASEVIRMKIDAIADGQQVLRIVVRADDGLMAEAEHTTQVISRADLSMSITEKAGAVKVGDEAAFEIKVENRGTKDADQVRVKVVLPQSMHAVQSKQYTVDNGEITFPALVVPTGGQNVLRFQAVGNAAGDQVVRVIMQSEWLSREIIMETHVYYYGNHKERVAAKP